MCFTSLLSCIPEAPLPGLPRTRFLEGKVCYLLQWRRNVGVSLNAITTLLFFFIHVTSNQMRDGEKREEKTKLVFSPPRKVIFMCVYLLLPLYRVTWL